MLTFLKKIFTCWNRDTFGTRIKTIFFGKLICHGRNRVEAIQRMNRSLDEFVIEGITTTIPLHKKLLNHKKFIDSDFNVSWLDKEKLI